jgi:WD40 repeat protein
MTMTCRLTVLTLLLPLSCAFFIVPHQRNIIKSKSPFGFKAHDSESSNNKEDEEEEEVLYNDFDFFIGSEGADYDSADTTTTTTNTPPSSPINPILQGRLNQLVLNEQESQEQISENWKQGHWSVRGCSLDPGDDGHNKVQVSSLCALGDAEEEQGTILVGRTDGSVCWLQLGSEYLVSFTNQLVAKESSNNDNTIQVMEELKREESTSVPMSDTTTSNFEVLAQLQASSSVITDMVVIDSKYLFLSISGGEQLLQYTIDDDGPISTEGTKLEDLHQSNYLVSLRNIQEKYLLSTSRNGKVVLWKVGTTSTAPIMKLSVPMEDDDSILSCDVDDDYIYFGSAQGVVFIYSLKQVVVRMDGGQQERDVEALEPLKSFSAFPKEGVSSICAAGEGIMGRGDSSTVALITGSTGGEIKQWELIPRGEKGVEYWPKLASQRLPGKAHVLKTNVGSSSSSSGDASVLALFKVQGVVLSANSNQLTIWDPKSGRAFFDMQGMEFGEVASCVVLSDQLLVTNGMDQYVCVHDFSIDPELEIEEMIQPQPED